MSRSLIDHPAPDPARAHGAWVYLLTSILAGAFSAGGRGTLAGLFAGLAFVGVFLVASAMAVYPRPWKRRFAIGIAIALGACGIGLLVGADPWFLVYSAVAVFPASAAVWYATRDGVQSPVALAFGVVTLTASAPAAACAGGTHPALGWLLLVLLAPFFAWRTWSVRRLMATQRGMKRRDLKRVGFREAFWAAGWTTLVLALIHVV